MHISTRSTVRAAAAGSALALAATGALFMSPAQAATLESASLNYDCNSPTLGNLAVTAKHSAPDTVVYGGKIPVTTTMTLSPEVVGGLNYFGIKSLDGDAVNHAIAAAVLPIEFTQTVQKTDVPATGSMDLVALGDVDTAPYSGAVHAGDVVPIAMNDIDGADIVAHLYTWNADGRSASPQTVNCELGDGQNYSVGNVTITQAATETVAKISYAKRAGKVVSKALVDAPESGVVPVGDVRLILKRNGEKINSDTVALKDGVATLKTAAPNKGNYKLVARYLGNTDFVASSDEATKALP